MKDFDKFNNEEEAEYNQWIKKNFKFIRRFIKECIHVDCDLKSDYYGSEWVETEVETLPPYQLVYN